MYQINLQCVNCVLQRICKFYTDEKRETECEYQHFYKEFFTKYLVVLLQLLRYQIERKINIK